MAMTKVLALVENGRIIAAQMGEQRRGNDKDTPEVEFEVSGGQQLVSLQVPEEVLRLRGVCLGRYFSQVKIHGPDQIILPKVKIVRKRK